MKAIYENRSQKFLRIPIILLLLTPILNPTINISEIEDEEFVVWNKIYYRSSWIDIPKSVHKLNDGGYLILGMEYEGPGSSILLIKTDSQGEMVWTYTWGGDFHIYAKPLCLYLASDNEYVILGHTYTAAPPYESSYNLYKINSHGDLIWSERTTILDEIIEYDFFISSSEMYKIIENNFVRIDSERDTILEIPIESSYSITKPSPYSITNPDGSIIILDSVQISEGSDARKITLHKIRAREIYFDINPVIVTAYHTLHPRKFFLYVTNFGPENVKDVSINVKSVSEEVYLIDDTSHIKYEEISVGSSALSENYLEISGDSDESAIKLESKISWYDSKGHHEGSVEFELPNPSIENNVEWSEMIWKMLSSQIVSLLALSIGVPTIPLGWLLSEFTGGMYRDSFIIFIADENGAPLNNVEVRTSLFEHWPRILVPPEHAIWTHEGIVHWTDAMNPLLDVKVMNWNDDGKQSIYIDPSAYNNLPEQEREVPIISIIFPSDGEISWLAPPLVKVNQVKHSDTLKVVGESPINIQIIDPQGRRIGYDKVSGSSLMEVPGGVYSGPGSEPQLITIQNPFEGKYRVTVYGKSEGAYKITTELLVSEGETMSISKYEGTISQGETHDLVTGLVSTNQVKPIHVLQPWYLENWYTIPASVIVLVLSIVFLIKQRKTSRALV